MNLLSYIGFPLAVFFLARIGLPNVRFEMDFDVSHPTFFLVHDRLAKIMWTVFGFGFVGAFVLQEVVGGYGEAPLTLLAASLFALLFNVWIILVYESYLHACYPKGGMNGASNYTVTKYSITFSLGTSAIAFFVIGMVEAMAALRLRI